MGRRTIYMGGTEGALLPKKKSTEDMDLDITPMIDVTFLLLIFFMVTSTMQEQVDIKTPTAKHGEGTNLEDSVTISIAAPLTETEEPEIRKGEKKGGEVMTLGDIEPYVTAQLAEGKNKQNIIIKADRDVPHGFVQQVLREVNRIDGVMFHIGVDDKNRSTN